MENREEVVPESQQYAGYDINQRNGELSLNQSNPACSNVYTLSLLCISFIDYIMEYL